MSEHSRSRLNDLAFALAPMPIAECRDGRLMAQNEAFTSRFGEQPEGTMISEWIAAGKFVTEGLNREQLEKTNLPRTHFFLQQPSSMKGGSPQYFKCEWIDAGNGDHLLYMTDDSATYFSRNKGMAMRHFLDGVLNNTSFFLIRVNMQGKYTYANESFLKTFGHDLEELKDTDVYCTVEPEDHQKMIDATMESIQFPGRKVVTVLRKPLPKKGEILTTQWEFVTIADAHGQPLEVQCAGININQQVQAQERFESARNEVQESVERMKEIIRMNVQGQESTSGSGGLKEALNEELQRLEQIHITAPFTQLKPYNLPSYETFNP